MKKLEIDIPLSSVILKGDLVIPENPIGIVIFSHGSGSSRFSSRNRMVAELIQKHNIATFLFDLLTEKEDQNYENRFNYRHNRTGWSLPSRIAAGQRLYGTRY